MPRDLAGFFASLGADPAAAAAARKSGAVVQFRLRAPDAFVVVDLAASPPSVSTAEHAAPDVELTLTRETAERILSGSLSVGEAARTGAVQARGGVLKLLALQPFLDAARNAWNRA